MTRHYVRSDERGHNGYVLRVTERVVHVLGRFTDHRRRAFQSTKRAQLGRSARRADLHTNKVDGPFICEKTGHPGELGFQ